MMICITDDNMNYNIKYTTICPSALTFIIAPDPKGFVPRPTHKELPSARDVQTVGE